MEYRGTTAVITGASSGSGAAFARQLAQRGADLGLVARRVERLQGLAAELHENHAVNIVVHQQDLSTPRAGAELARRTGSG